MATVCSSLADLEGAPPAPGSWLSPVLTHFHHAPLRTPPERRRARTDSADLFASPPALLPSMPGHCQEGTSLPCPVLKGLSLHQTPPPPPCPQRTLSLSCREHLTLVSQRGLEVGCGLLVPRHPSANLLLHPSLFPPLPSSSSFPSLEPFSLRLGQQTCFQVRRSQVLWPQGPLYILKL